MLALRRREAIVQFFERLESETKTTDIQNMTDLVCGFTDLNDISERKKDALKVMLDKHSYLEDDDDSGYFFFMHKGEEITCMHIQTMEETGYYCGDDFLEAGDVIVIVQRAGLVRSIFCARNTTELAAKIFEALDEKKICRFCGRLISDPTKFDNCAECAIWELKHPCKTCGIQMDRGDDEHPVCKKRRLNN